MQDPRPANPTPSSGRTLGDTPGKGSDWFQGGLEEPPKNKVVKKQPSLSDLLKANIISIDGVKTPSISELMDFDISPGDLLPENDSTFRKSNNDSPHEPTSPPRRGEGISSVGNKMKGGKIKTSPLKRPQNRATKQTGSVYQTWNSTGERRKRAAGRGLPVGQFKACPPPRNTVGRPQHHRGGRPSEAMDISITGNSPTRSGTGPHPTSSPKRSQFREDRNGHVLSHIPPRPSGPLPFSPSGRRSAWDSSSSEEDTDDEGQTALAPPSDNEHSEPSPQASLQNIHASSFASANGNTSAGGDPKLLTAMSSSQIDMVSAKIIRLCIETKDGAASLEAALNLFNRLIANGVILKLPGVYKSIIIRCCKEKNVAQALAIFDRMCQASVQFDVEVWERLNQALVSGGMIEKAAALLSNMRWKNLSPKPEFYVITMLACVTIGKIGLADALLSKSKDELPVAFLHHIVDVCTTLLSNWKLAGYRARETSLLEFIGNLDYLIDLNAEQPKAMEEATGSAAPTEWDGHFFDDPKNALTHSNATEEAFQNLEKVLSRADDMST
jgi:pentatricopeptide repeat protein